MEITFQAHVLAAELEKVHLLLDEAETVVSYLLTNRRVPAHVVEALRSDIEAVHAVVAWLDGLGLVEDVL